MTGAALRLSTLCGLSCGPACWVGSFGVEWGFSPPCLSCRELLSVGYCDSRPAFPEIALSLQELDSAVSQLPADELSAFERWVEEDVEDAGDRRLEEDIKAGRLDGAGRRADADFEAGRCKPL